jgi:ParB family chromosome partitioning protein
MAGLTEVPAYIRTADDQEMLEMALVENIQRRDLNAIEVALTYKRLIEECNLTQEALSKRVSKNRSSITNHLRLLRLNAEVQLAIKEGKISMGHARALVNVDNEKWQLQIVKKIIEEGTSVRAVEDLVRKYNEKQNTQKKPVQESKEETYHYEDFVVKLVDKLNQNIEITSGKNGEGKIIIPFKNLEDLEKIIAELTQ